MGGKGNIERQHALGKLTARERLNLLFDPGSFHELDLFVRHRSSQFGMEKTSVPAEGVVTGYGTINYNPYIGTSRGIIDDVIMPRDTRETIISALECTVTKQEIRPPRKHGNIPL